MKLDRFAAVVVEDHRRTVIVGVLAVVVLAGFGVPGVALDTTLEQFRGGTPEHAADGYVEENLGGQAPNSTGAFVVVRSDGNALSTAAYRRQLRAQRRLRSDPVVGPTLVDDQQPLGVANVVAIVKIRREQGVDPDEITVEPRPSLARQRAAIANLTDRERELYTGYAVTLVLGDVDHTWPEGGAFSMVPTSYLPSDRRAESTAIVVSHREDTPPAELARAQTRMAEIVDEETEGNASVIGDGVVDDELRRSSFDSLAIVAPPAVLFVVAVLLFAYRDLLDVALGLLGVGLVLVWTLGFMGWAGIVFNQLFVAVPVLLMGLSIDYAIHVFMRHREERPPDDASSVAVDGGNDDGRPRSVRGGMATALGGLGGALALVTATTATGFASNLVSGIAPIRQFGLVSAVGIVGAFVVFALLIPALKVELDERLEAAGVDRRRRAFGTGGGRLSALLALPVAGARLSPGGVVAAALVVTLVAGAGAATVDTTFEQQDLLVEETPAWMDDLGPLAPGDYAVQRNIAYADNATYVYDGTTTQVLVRGDVTDDDTLERVQAASDRANRTGVPLVLPDDTNATRSPVRVMADLAEDDDEFAAAYAAADGDGDGVPDRNLEALYDAFFEAAPEGAAGWIHREDGDYVALRLVVPVAGTTSEPAATATARAAAEPVDGDGLEATATGQPVMNQAVAEDLFATVLEALLVTLAVVLAVLVAVYRRTEGYASLGVVTLTPVVLAVAWITGSMAALGVPFNVMTGLITSFTIGLGIDYSIHVSERYVYELNRGVGAETALERTIFGTGGALLGSTATTAGGVAILGLALLAPLQQFGVITALTIVYALLGSVVVLPSLLVLWTRWAGADPAGR